MDWKTSEYQKVIAIRADMLNIIDKIRGKKSKAGKLQEIIEFYLAEKSQNIKIN